MSGDDKPNDLQLGALLGEMRAELRLQRESSSKIEPQLLQILDSQNRADNEMSQLSRAVVDVREGMHAIAIEAKLMHARVEKLEAGVHRPPSHSVTNEVRGELAAQHDSLRVVAEKTEDVRQETYRQTDVLAQQSAAMASQAPAIVKASKNSSLAAFVAGLGAIATLLTTILQSCHH